LFKEAKLQSVLQTIVAFLKPVSLINLIYFKT